MQDSQIPPHMEPIPATSQSARASTPSRAGVTSRAPPRQQPPAPSQHSRDTGGALRRLEQRIRELEGTRWSRDSTQDSDWEPSVTDHPHENSRVRPAELVSYRGPLSEEIMLYRIPAGYRRPTDMEKYYGTTDPQTHLDLFTGFVEFDGSVEALMCRAFNLPLRGAASRWYNSLPRGSITCWSELATRFLAQFGTNREPPRTSGTLTRIKQRKGESIRDFLTYFYSEARLIPGISADTILVLLLEAL